MNKELLKEYFAKMKSRNGVSLAKTTINNYINKINRLSEIVRGVPQSDLDFSWLDQHEKVLDKLRKSTLTSKKDYLSPVCRILKERDVSQDILEPYQRSMADHKKDEDHQRGENKATPSQLQRFLPLDQIKKAYHDYDWSAQPNQQKGLLCKTIVAFYFMNELVPRNNLNVLKLVSSRRKPKDCRNDCNYVLVDDNDTPQSLLWCRYKTDSTYGKVKFPVTPELAKILKVYIRAFDRKKGQYLFPSGPDGEPYSEKRFAEIVPEAHQEVVGKPLNIDLIRAIHITDFFKHGPHSINEEENFAKRFLHSSDVQREYMRLDLDRKSDDDV